MVYFFFTFSLEATISTFLIGAAQFFLSSLLLYSEIKLKLTKSACFDQTSMQKNQKARK